MEVGPGKANTKNIKNRIKDTTSYAGNSGSCECCSAHVDERYEL